jgi:hypothetical protein
MNLGPSAGFRDRPPAELADRQHSPLTLARIRAAISSSVLQPGSSGPRRRLASCARLAQPWLLNGRRDESELLARGRVAFNGLVGSFGPP